MMRSPLVYPLNRGADMEIGGTADLQTDVMRFMAILSLCLVAIFALVQSVPMTPPAEQPAPAPVSHTVAALTPAAIDDAVATPAPVAAAVAEVVLLTRPKWVPKYQPKTTPPAESVAEPATKVAVETIAIATPQTQGFTLRFESDAALTRLVAASQVGVYAIEGDRARRMTVSESRISFWDASVPGSFHEMEVSTVPLPVIDALARSGATASNISWGVTLPGKLKTQLDELMREHRGGSLVIGSNGNIRLEDL